MVKISTVIPLYNKEREVLRAISSVLRQNSIVDEIIVVDDGSSDFGAELVRRTFPDEVILLRQANSGVSSARNAGISAASHPLVCLLDADDEWMPGYIEEIRKLIDEHPDAVFYSCNHFLQEEGGRRVSCKLGLKSDFFGLVGNFPLTYSKGYGLISSSSVCVRKSLYKDGCVFPEGKKLGEDIYYWLRISMEGDLAFSAKPLVKIYLDADNRSKSLRGVVPFHIEWYLERRHVIGATPYGRDIKKFVIHNALVTAYGLVEAGNVGSAKLIVREFIIRREWVSLLFIPAFVIPRSVLRVSKSVRRWLR